MGTVACRVCNGSGRFYDKKSGKTFDCQACGGSGINRNLWSTKCERCRREIIYKAGADSPRFCKDCRNIQLEKNCAQFGCSNKIRYKVGWDRVPDYCKRCETKRHEGWTASNCPGTGLFGCGKLIWSPPGKNFTLCQECNERKRAADAEKWKEKPCAGGCGKMIRYRIDWEHIPNFCTECKNKRQQSRHESNQSENPRFHAACGRNGAKLTLQEKDRFSDFFHILPDRQRLSFDKIVQIAEEWKKDNSGGFRRSDRG